MPRRALPVVVGVAAAVLVACGSAATGPGGAVTSASARGEVTAQPSRAAPEPTVETVQPARLPADAGHVHGLTVSQDGTVLLGTHHGVYAVQAAAGVQKIGAAGDDFMGFTGTSSRLLASGHPGPGSAQPNPLGLVESRDGGRTWQQLSRSGQSDFHALTFSGRTVYGFDGSLKVSTDDGRTWTDHGDVIAPAVLAAHPRTATTVLATTQDGVQQSTDGGRTFSPTGGALLLQTLSWPSPDVLYGVEPSGQVHLSTDGARTWSKRGQVSGQPHAFAAADNRTLAVATADAVFISADGGITFQPLATTR